VRISSTHLQEAVETVDELLFMSGIMKLGVEEIGMGMWRDIPDYDFLK
jgi:hypothetical protein